MTKDFEVEQFIESDEEGPPFFICADSRHNKYLRELFLNKNMLLSINERTILFYRLGFFSGTQYSLRYVAELLNMDYTRAIICEFNGLMKIQGFHHRLLKDFLD